MDMMELKHKLRNLKNLESKIRLEQCGNTEKPLIWNSFFDLTETRHVKYSVAHLLHAGQQEYRRIVDEYWAFVYSDIFGQLMSDETIQYDKDLLIKLDLPFDADEAAVKKRFRSLAKQVHPDMGGDAHQFIELMDIYRRLITK